MYEINTRSLDKCKKDNVANVIYAIMILTIYIVLIIYIIKINGPDYYLYPLILIGSVMNYIYISETIKKIVATNKKYKDIEHLQKNGKLVKKVPYALRRSDVKRGKPTIRLRIIVMHYTLPTGITLTLESEPRDDSLTLPKEGFADLLIDENNPDRYFIDTEINRNGGNKKEDFYKEEK